MAAQENLREERLGDKSRHILTTLASDWTCSNEYLYGNVHRAAKVQALCISEFPKTQHPSKAQLHHKGISCRDTLAVFKGTLLPCHRTSAGAASDAGFQA